MECIDIAKVISFSREKPRKVGLFRTERCQVDLYYLQPGQSQAPHVHEGIDKVYYIVEGKGSFTIGGEERALGKGEVALAPAKAEHGLENRGPGSLVMLVFVAPPLSEPRR